MSRRTMRLSAVGSEAARNVTSSRIRTLLLLTIATLGFAGLAISDTATIAQITSQADTFRDSGAATLILDTPRLVGGASCDRLADVDGIIAAGAIRTAREPLQPAATPQQNIPLQFVSPGFSSIIDTDISIGITLADDAAELYTATLPARMATADGTVIIGGTYPFPDDGRIPTLTYAAIVVASPDTGLFDACWATMWPADPGKQVLLYSAITAIPPAEADITIIQLNGTLGQSFDGAGRFAQRITRYAPVIAATVGLVLVIGSARFRRLELAAARHLGVSRTALSCQLLIETLCWAPVAALAAAAATTAAGVTIGADTAAIMLGMKVIGLGLAGILIGAAIAGATTSPRRLVTYFKQR